MGEGDDIKTESLVDFGERTAQLRINNDNDGRDTFLQKFSRFFKSKRLVVT